MEFHDSLVFHLPWKSLATESPFSWTKASQFADSIFSSCSQQERNFPMINAFKDHTGRSNLKIKMLFICSSPVLQSIVGSLLLFRHHLKTKKWKVPLRYFVFNLNIYYLLKEKHVEFRKWFLNAFIFFKMVIQYLMCSWDRQIVFSNFISIILSQHINFQ